MNTTFPITMNNVPTRAFFGPPACTHLLLQNKHEEEYKTILDACGTYGELYIASKICAFFSQRARKIWMRNDCVDGGGVCVAVCPFVNMCTIVLCFSSRKVTFLPRSKVVSRAYICGPFPRREILIFPLLGEAWKNPLEWLAWSSHSLYPVPTYKTSYLCNVLLLHSSIPPFSKRP